MGGGEGDERVFDGTPPSTSKGSLPCLKGGPYAQLCEDRDTVRVEYHGRIIVGNEGFLRRAGEKGERDVFAG